MVQNAPVHMVIDNHCEEISLHVVRSPQLSLILGIMLLYWHNPYWQSGWVLGWCPICLASCLRAAVSTAKNNKEFLDLSAVPPEYHDLKEVINKSWATSFSPHKPYDCPIDILPRPHQTLDDYWMILESLAAGLIRPSSSPAGSKKDGELRSCIDYWGPHEYHYKKQIPSPAFFMFMLPVHADHLPDNLTLLPCPFGFVSETLDSFKSATFHVLCFGVHESHESQ